MREPDGFREFVVARSGALLRSAWLLTGNEASAQDLVQASLAKSWSRWSMIVNREDPEAYVRRVMLSTFLTWRRRRWRDEIPTAAPPERVANGNQFDEIDSRHSITELLKTLPPRQRAVVVLRYYNDLSEAQTADYLGCSVGTVKSQAARALSRLRSGLQTQAHFHGDGGVPT